MQSLWLWKWVLCSIGLSVIFLQVIRADDDNDSDMSEVRRKREDIELNKRNQNSDVVEKREDFDNIKLLDEKFANDMANDLANVNQKREYDEDSSNAELNDLNKRNEEIDDDEKKEKEHKLNIIEDRKHKKRLETIDGVEIASSYREYIELAIGDLEDRLKKHEFQLDYTIKLTLTRKKLFEQIDKEIYRRRRNIEELREKNKRLIDRLSQNTKMKEALNQLANIAGLKLRNKRSDMKSVESITDEFSNLDNENATAIANSLINSNEFLNNVKNAVTNDKSNNTYNQYIEMAYAEVNAVLTSDKQTLIEVIRQIKDNNNRLKKLISLKSKVEESLRKFEGTRNKLSDLISFEKKILESLLQLRDVIQQHSSRFLSLVTPKTDQSQAVTTSPETVTPQYKTESPLNTQNGQL